MKSVFLPLVLAGATMLASSAAMAQAAVPESSLSFNAGVVSDYRYRGISQSRLKPAVQGGFDYADKSGFYVGAWGSTIKWIKDTPPATDGSLELDLYGGYKGTAGAVSYDVGVLRYEYVGSKGYSPNPNTTEIYGAVTAGVFTVKYSHALTNTFGNPSSKNSNYIDLSATLDLGNGLSLVPHAGKQKIKGPNQALCSYSDYSVTL
ncbi:MAG: hypothetical protein FJY42_13450, partial [Betaproteobacteria bacterium]|nr:hypothetical protein [Betaproteobacteria bacterium]